MAASLQNFVESLSMKNQVLEDKLTVARNSSNDMMQKWKDVEGKCNHLQQNLNKLQEKLVNMENENHILRQKALSMNNLSAPKTLSEESHEILLRCIKENFGFKEGKPVAACIIYKYLLEWRAFESERTAIFDHVIEAINDVLKGTEADGILPYWLSNTSALLCLLQNNLQSNGLFTAPSRRSVGAQGLGGEIVQTLRSPSKLVGRSDGLPQVDARYPAILFKQQLTACVEKIFEQLRDNLKKEISPLLSVCIQAPKTSGQRGNAFKSPGTRAQAPSNSNWDNIVNFLDLLMDTLRDNHVPSFFIRKLVTQLFSFINIQLFNSLLLRREICTMSNGEYVKAGLSLLEKWISNVTEEFAGTSWHELNYIRQAVGFLVISSANYPQPMFVCAAPTAEYLPPLPALPIIICRDALHLPQQDTNLALSWHDTPPASPMPISPPPRHQPRRALQPPPPPPLTSYTPRPPCAGSADHQEAQ